jgi:Fur family transcriptional regulator, zinc uptake regulator
VEVMINANTKDMVNEARHICEITGNRLTETRQHVLEVLLTLDTPVSAYELTERYNLLIDAPIMAMSVYRILDFLESIHLVHRIHSINKYIICNHGVGACKHQPPFFLICKSCHHIKHVEIPTEFITTFLQQVEIEGFLSIGSQFELNSLCENCKASIKQNSPGVTHD